MGSKDRRERERQETRGKILEAARELFAHQGVEAVTMRAIADRIEYTPTAIYHHFQDKTHLVYECCQEDFYFLAREIERLAKTDDPVERILQLGEAYADFGLKHRNHYRFMFMTPLPPMTLECRPPDKGNPDVDAYAAVLHAVRAAIDRALFRPEYSDAQLAAQVLWAAVHGIVSLWIIKGGDQLAQQHKGPDFLHWAAAPRELVRKTCEAVLRGMLRDPDLLPADGTAAEAGEAAS